MTTGRWQRLEALFHEALAVPEIERTGWLSARCAGEPGLAGELDSLLAAATRADEVLAVFERPIPGPGNGSGEERTDEPLPGGVVGAYRLLRPIGRGGMSRVYLAERIDDDLRRQVAIKRFSAPGAGADDELLRRFRAEGTVLASMSHPNIAQVFDAGVDQAGVPYLVMELVEGEPITDHCARTGMAADEAIELFLAVCAAVHHAHQRLVVHRDLKPSNILMDRSGRPRLLDFGIAKLLDADSGAGADVPRTRTRWLPLTLEYAAPEQLTGGEITTATDVYGLGLVLYELLTGCRPFDLRGLTPGEIERTVRQQEPTRPSVLVARTGTAGAAGREGESGRRRRLTGDLDAIVLRALAKEPQRRYGSARELADDLRRHLRHEAVEARPPTLAYRTGRLLRRHGTAVASLAAVIALIVALVGFYTLRLAAERRQAERQAQRAQQVVGLLGELFWSADPRRTGQSPETVAELLARSEQAVRRLESEPLVQAELLHFLGLANSGQGDHETAGSLFAQALTLRQDHLPPSDPLIAESLNHVGWMSLRRDRFAAAEASFAEAVRRQQASAPTAELTHSLRGLALARNGLGRTVEAEALLVRTVTMLESLVGPEHPFVAESLQNLAIVRQELGKSDAAREALGRSLAIRRRLSGADDLGTADALGILAMVEQHEGFPERAAELLIRALAIRTTALGSDHPMTVQTRRQLARAQTAAAARAEAASRAIEAPPTRPP